MESQGVDPDQFVCKVFGGWNWLDYAYMFEMNEEEETINEFLGKPFNVKNVLEFQYMEDTFYIYNKLTDYKGYLKEDIVPTNFVVSQSDEGELFKYNYTAGFMPSTSGRKFTSSDWMLDMYLLDVDGNKINEPVTEENRLAVFSAAQCTKDLKGLKIEKMYIMRPSSGMEYVNGKFKTVFYDVFFYYVTNYGDYIFFTDRLYTFLMPLEMFEAYLYDMRCYIHNHGKDLEPIMDNEYTSEEWSDKFPMHQQHGYLREREFSPDTVLPSYCAYPYIIFGWRETTLDAILKIEQGIYP